MVECERMYCNEVLFDKQDLGFVNYVLKGYLHVQSESVPDARG